MRVDRIRFGKVKAQWQILMMKTAYIEAEKAIVQDPSLTKWQEDMTAETFAKMDAHFDHVQYKSIKEVQRENLEQQILSIEDTARRLLEEEKYELLQEAKEIWQKLKDQLDNLG